MAPPPYKQVPLSSPLFTKQCLCPEGGPNGTKRCRNKSYCDLVRKKDVGLAEEAEELRKELLDEWHDYDDRERRVKAYRLAELRLCEKDQGKGRNVEVGDGILAQRGEEEEDEKAAGPGCAGRGNIAARHRPSASASQASSVPDRNRSARLRDTCDVGFPISHLQLGED